MQKFVCISKKTVKTKKDTEMEIVGLVKADAFNKFSDELPIVAVNTSGKEVPKLEPFEGKIFLKFGEEGMSVLYQIGKDRPNKVQKEQVAE